jgi:hypothetical protein
MRPPETAAPARQKTGIGPVFTVERANRALVLVRKITADIVARYQQLMDLRAQALEAGDDEPGMSRALTLQSQVDRCLEILGRLNRELRTIGCHLKDWRTGLIDFPAVYDGRRVWLCWRLGEAHVAHWHEISGGFPGRRPVPKDFV